MAHGPWLVTTLAVAASAACAIVAAYRGNRRGVFLFKPLTTVLIIAAVLWISPPGESRYPMWILLGLLCSLAGDVFLMLPRDRFVAGLASFLLAHVAYVVAFTSGVPLGTAPGILVPAALPGGVVLALLWSRLGALRGPVAIYVVVITLMAWQATARVWTLHTGAAALAACGAACFVASDALLALNRFRTPFRSAQALVMGTYVVAQWLIALSVGAATS